mmetsp:Transcript_10758/g.22757  ORF Transcript_10758/g.22757 Transcript_10758/m.22757 type:complete len:801 (-) Transcript_10758:2060-4462(-)
MSATFPSETTVGAATTTVTTADVFAAAAIVEAAASKAPQQERATVETAAEAAARVVDNVVEGTVAAVISNNMIPVLATASAPCHVSTAPAAMGGSNVYNANAGHPAQAPQWAPLLLQQQQQQNPLGGIQIQQPSNATAAASTSATGAIAIATAPLNASDANASKNATTATAPAAPVNTYNTLQKSKRKERLEQNRISARESRKRKKSMIEELQRTVIGLTAENKELNGRNQSLRSNLADIGRKYPNSASIQSILNGVPNPSPQQQQQQQHGNHETGGGRATEGLSLLGGDDDEKQTVVAGRGNNGNERATDNPVEIALNRAREVSHWIRKDVWKILGFTMSAGISTNKTMAKLAASYGKPNGQAVLYPKWFPNVLAETKITKVRNFGGKLGKTVLKLLLEYRQKEEQAWQTSTTTRPNDADSLEMLRSEATMADLNQIPLPFLLQSGSLSNESARFVFSAGRGIDHEAVKETSGALVKSITAFKSFTATKSHADIFDRWLSILAKEIVDRVARDTTRNKRYPRSCTLNYTYYTTSNGHRPSTTKGSSTSSTRSQRQSRSIRLSYPSEREGSQHQKSASLLARAKAKLVPIVRDHPLRGVGLSVSNFAESSSGGQQKAACTVSIQSFFASTTKNLAVSSSSLPPPPRTNNAEQGTSEDRGKVTADKPTGIIGFSTNNNDNDNTGDWTGGSSGASKPIRVAPTKRGRTECLGTECFPLSPSSQSNLDPIQASMVANPGTNRHDLQRILTNSEALTNKDLDYARKLQASFDRENYALSTANRRRQSVSSGKKTRRIDYFFRKR